MVAAWAARLRTVTDLVDCAKRHRVRQNFRGCVASSFFFICDLTHLQGDSLEADTSGWLDARLEPNNLCPNESRRRHTPGSRKKDRLIDKAVLEASSLLRALSILLRQQDARG